MPRKSKKRKANAFAYQLAKSARYCYHTGIAATKADLTEWVYEQGLTALHLLLREDAEKIAGPKGKHEKERGGASLAGVATTDQRQLEFPATTIRIPGF